MLDQEAVEAVYLPLAHQRWSGEFSTPIAMARVNWMYGTQQGFSAETRHAILAILRELTLHYNEKTALPETREPFYRIYRNRVVTNSAFETFKRYWSTQQIDISDVVGDGRCCVRHVPWSYAPALVCHE